MIMQYIEQMKAKSSEGTPAKEKKKAAKAGVMCLKIGLSLPTSCHAFLQAK